MANLDTRTAVERVAERLLAEVPALRKLNVDVAIEVHARHDVQDIRVQPAGPRVTKELVPDARIKVEIRRDVLNDLQDATLQDFVEAYRVGRIKPTGVPQYLQLVGNVIGKAAVRQRQRTPQRRPAQGH